MSIAIVIESPNTDRVPRLGHALLVIDHLSDLSVISEQRNVREDTEVLEWTATPSVLEYVAGAAEVICRI